MAITPVLVVHVGAAGAPQAADRLKSCDIDRRVRGWEKPSDHVPVWCELSV